ncbi:hypothetical protein LVD17_20660 [Fulvivirga ulvae]|uniref:hypothetical protein n=1 Tax=Fulvivirga ulvae TaxID=2904245 RepID=UPI001F4065A7|nr:hypothetical protein [Fulvivirga ulvae]UII30709.1 hypothetical protein LVD17_20660 [Fulvivirga ulvae]
MRKKHTEPIQPDTYYHVYNRGINGESIFKEARNYNYFLEKYAQHINPVADTYAYCLLNNHFHFLIRTCSAEVISDRVQNPVRDKGNNFSAEVDFSKTIGKQFAKLFNSYSQSINKAYGRTGSLFDRPFRRIPVQNDYYFSRLVSYIHKNPEKHGFTDDFKDYPYSSYWSHLDTRKTRLKREEVINWFGDQSSYQEFHILSSEDGLNDFIIEV